MLSNRDLLAKTLQAEAGNQGLGGMMAVGSVIMNRVKSGQSLCDIILAPGQFSAWNSVTGYAGGEQGQDMEAIQPSKDAYAAADAILSGNYADVTGGATHYYNPDISQPKWGASAGGDWTKIGAHLFGKADAPKRGKPTMDGQQPMPMQAQQMQQMQRQPRGLMDFLRDPRTRQTLASMDRSGMFEGIAEQATQDIVRQEERQTANRTAAWLKTQPGGEPYAQAIESGMDARAVYTQYMRDKGDASDGNVQSRSILPDNSGTVITLRDGSQFVMTAGGQKLTGAEADEFVTKAQERYTAQQRAIYGARREGTLGADIELGGAAEQVKAEGKAKVPWINEVRKERDNIMSTISNYDLALAALDSGASTGRVAQLLPTITSQTQLLETAKKQLGLDVIGSVTFGALSADELKLALDTGLPSDNLGPEELRKWILDRKAAKEKAAQALFETAAYLSKKDTTYESYYTDFLGIQKNGSTPGAAGGASADNPLGLD